MASSDLNSLGEGRAVGGGVKHRETCRTKPKHYGCNTMGVIALAKEASMIWSPMAKAESMIWSSLAWEEESMI